MEIDISTLERPTAVGVLQTAVPTWRRAAKRTVDVVGSSVLLIVASPVLLVLAITVKLDSRGPFLFAQERLGRRGDRFAMLKFRSMHPDAEMMLEANPALYEQFVANGYKLAASDDPRITRLGRLMRKTSLDELPQLVNVLLGHMSLVGPRPPLADQTHVLYGELVDHYFSVRPGLTGPWQVSGRSDLTPEERRDLDVDYTTSYTVLGDLALLVRTIPAVLRQRGAV